MMEAFYLSEKIASVSFVDLDETTFQKYKRIFKEKIAKFYVDHIPVDSIQEMSPVCKRISQQ